MTNPDCKSTVVGEGKAGAVTQRTDCRCSSGRGLVPGGTEWGRAAEMRGEQRSGVCRGGVARAREGGRWELREQSTARAWRQAGVCCRALGSLAPNNEPLGSDQFCHLCRKGETWGSRKVRVRRVLGEAKPFISQKET